MNAAEAFASLMEAMKKLAEEHDIELDTHFYHDHGLYDAKPSWELCVATRRSYEASQPFWAAIYELPEYVEALREHHDFFMGLHITVGWEFEKQENREP